MKVSVSVTITKNNLCRIRVYHNSEKVLTSNLIKDINIAKLANYLDNDDLIALNFTTTDLKQLLNGCGFIRRTINI